MNFLDDEEKMRDFHDLSKEDFLRTYNYLTEDDYNATMEALNDTNEIFKYNNKNYNFKVRFDEDSKLLKLTMVDLNTKNEIAINISGVIPQRRNTRLYIIK